MGPATTTGPPDFIGVGTQRSGTMVEPGRRRCCAAAAPDAKLLVMLSDPIERYRAVSAERLAKRSDGERLYMADGVHRRSFGAQLARLQRFYDPERILGPSFAHLATRLTAAVR